MISNIHFLKFFVLLLLIWGCSWNHDVQTIRVVINKKQEGWYFIVLRNNKDKKVSKHLIRAKFRGEDRVVIINVNDFNKTIISPFDQAENDVSNRLKFSSVSEGGNGVHVFKFYNPTDKELTTIKKWNPEDSKADSILMLENLEYNRYVNGKL